MLAQFAPAVSHRSDLCAYGVGEPLQVPVVDVSVLAVLRRARDSRQDRVGRHRCRMSNHPATPIRRRTGGRLHQRQRGAVVAYDRPHVDGAVIEGDPARGARKRTPSDAQAVRLRNALRLAQSVGLDGLAVEMESDSCLVPANGNMRPLLALQGGAEAQRRRTPRERDLTIASSLPRDADEPRTRPSRPRWQDRPSSTSLLRPQARDPATSPGPAQAVAPPRHA